VVVGSSPTFGITLLAFKIAPLFCLIRLRTSGNASEAILVDWTFVALPILALCKDSVAKRVRDSVKIDVSRAQRLQPGRI
jgi:hypothetical protein